MKLSRKRSIRLSFVASKLALATGSDERLALLAELLDELGIDADQRADSKESAARHLRFEASRKRKSERQAKPAAADDIDSMTRDDLRAHLDELRAKRDRLLAERSQRPDIDAMTDEERAAYQARLMGKITAQLDGMTPRAPEPAPVVTEAPRYALPTKRMEKAVAAFDDLTDGEQVDALQAMWGAA